MLVQLCLNIDHHWPDVVKTLFNCSTMAPVRVCVCVCVCWQAIPIRTTQYHRNPITVLDIRNGVINSKIKKMQPVYYNPCYDYHCSLLEVSDLIRHWQENSNQWAIEYEEVEEGQCFKLALRQPLVWRISDFTFLASAYQGGWPVLFLAISTSHQQCTMSILFITELTRGCSSRQKS